MNVRSRTLLLAASLAAVSALGTPSAGRAAALFDCKLPGLAAGLWADGQSPLAGDTYPPGQARERLAVLAQATDAVRLYDARIDEQAACIAKRELGLHVTLGAWIDADTATNDDQIAAVIQAANDGCVDDILVGNEVLLREEQSAQYLVEKIEEVRSAVPEQVRVGTAEVWRELVQHHALILASDFVAAHAHSYWAGIPTDEAVAYARKVHDTVAAIAGNREVVLGEIGIPTAGLSRGGATTGVAEANRFLVAVTAWARDSGVAFFYFAGFDEAWKSGEPGGVGAHWGVFNADTTLKAGLEDVFNCAVVDVPPPPPEVECTLPVVGEELLDDPNMSLCSWSPGWYPTTSGSLCLRNQHNRSVGAFGYYNYTSSQSDAAGIFAWREQRLDPVSVDNGFLAARVHVRAGNLDEGVAFLSVVLYDADGDPVYGDEAIATKANTDAHGEPWYPLDLSLPAVPCAAERVDFRFGVRKEQAGPSQAIASLDDASLVVLDNCSEVDNPNQRDTDSDGYGNFCDADFVGNRAGDGIVNVLDLGWFKQRFLTADEHADLNGDGIVNVLDLGLLKSLFLLPPGPSDARP